MVRVDALRGLRARDDADACPAALEGARDRDVAVALVALDLLAACAAQADALDALEHYVTDLSSAGDARGWHRAAHAIVALAAASPDRASPLLAQLSGSRIWQLRMYAARAAAHLSNRDALAALAKDDDDNVREAAVEGLRKVAGHDADAIYMDGLTRAGHQIVRVSALALEGTPHVDEVAPALNAAWQRLVAEGRDNSHDARDAIAKTLAALGVDAKPRQAPARAPVVDLNADDLRRLASPKARVTIRSVGTFDLALFTVQAPATVLRFARLAESGYYNGLTFHRVVPNFVIQGGDGQFGRYPNVDPERVGSGGPPYTIQDEPVTTPYRRGVVAMARSEQPNSVGSQFFIVLDDSAAGSLSDANTYQIIGEVTSGMDAVDAIAAMPNGGPSTGNAALQPVPMTNVTVANP
jgi:peptidyl-prolyl cis-trans isomerase B (cyclophilin B)